MNKKIITLICVFSLFILCIIKTCLILEINTEKTEEKTEEYNEENKNDKKIINCSNPNMFQVDDTGMSLFDNDDIYYNTGSYIVKYDIYSGEKSPIIASEKIKNMTDGGEYIYGVITMMNGNGVDCDYLMKFSKSDGETEIFYKTECQHITSVIFDGETVYYTNDNHEIYNLNKTEPAKWYSSSSSADYPYIIGINDGCMYITDGTGIEVIDIISARKKEKIDVLCSYSQKPIMYDGKIYAFSDFTCKEISEIDIKTKEIRKIVDYSFIKFTARAGKINTFSVSSEYLYFNCNGRIYSKKLYEENRPKVYKDIESLQSSSFGNYVYSIDGDKINVFGIN